MANPRIGVIGIPDRWSTEVLADAVEARTGTRLIIDMANVYADLDAMTLRYKDTNLCELDALIVKKISTVYSPNTIDRLELLRLAEGCGVRIFSGSENMLRLINRLSCTITLRNNNIPMPDTCITEDIDTAFSAVRQYQTAIFKPLFSTKARGMRMIVDQESDESVYDAIAEFKRDNTMMYIQRKAELPGHDLGMVFLGGEYICTYARVSGSDAWNTTIHSGGRYEAFIPSQDMIDLAYRAQAPFRMDYTTVDIAQTESGPVVFEVSAFGGFRGAKEGAGIDAAGLYVDYVLNELNGQ